MCCCAPAGPFIARPVMMIVGERPTVPGKKLGQVTQLERALLCASEPGVVASALHRVGPFLRSGNGCDGSTGQQLRDGFGAWFYSS